MGAANVDPLNSQTVKVSNALLVWPLAVSAYTGSASFEEICTSQKHQSNANTLNSSVTETPIEHPESIGKAEVS